MAELFRALEKGIDGVTKQLESVDWFDGIHALEYAEVILGIAFVAAQTYISGTVSDLKDIIGSSENIQKGQLLALDEKTVKCGVSKLQLIDAIANYFKHHEEWSGWEIDGKNKQTIETLNRCAITKHTEFPCYLAATLLWPRVSSISSITC